MCAKPPVPSCERLLREVFRVLLLLLLLNPKWETQAMNKFTDTVLCVLLLLRVNPFNQLDRHESDTLER